MKFSAVSNLFKHTNCKPAQIIRKEVYDDSVTSLKSSYSSLESPRNPNISQDNYTFTSSLLYMFSQRIPLCQSNPQSDFDCLLSQLPFFENRAWTRPIPVMLCRMSEGFTCQLWRLHATPCSPSSALTVHTNYANRNPSLQLAL